jgi:SLT domain-containing protein
MKAVGILTSMFGGGSSRGLESIDMQAVNKYSTPFAEGGFVTGPTNALIGEAGQPEYVIPASKMRESMNRYAAGARGPSVISGSDSSGATGGTVTMAPAAIDVRYTVERINSVDYVTADQFRSGMQQAAQQGATQGEQRTLRRLQMSATTRRKVGI